jgi:hypothetical protein
VAVQRNSSTGYGVIVTFFVAVAVYPFNVHAAVTV